MADTAPLIRAQVKLENATDHLRRLRFNRDEAVRDALRGGMSTRDVARVIGLSQQAVQKIAHAATSTS